MIIMIMPIVAFRDCFRLSFTCGSFNFDSSVLPEYLETPSSMAVFLLIIRPYANIPVPIRFNNNPIMLSH